MQGQLKSAPLQDAEVTLTCPGCPALATDADGAFHYQGVRPGRYSLRVRKDGFYPEEFKEYSVREGREFSYGPVYLEPCPAGDCDPKKRPPRTVPIYE
jgi:hypothetical protein